MTIDTDTFLGRDQTLEGEDLVETALQDLSELVAGLMAVTTDTNHSDADGMPDSVERVIGTDPLNDDSDFDGLNDYEEILLSMDPESPDSNHDKFPDLKEVMGVPLDMNGDGNTDDVWDIDERSLRLWSLSALDERWNALGSSSDMSGVNTTDQEIFGTRYSGYVWANLTELSWFVLAGRSNAIDVRVDIRSSDGNDKVSLKSGENLKVTIYGNENAEGDWIDIGTLLIGSVGTVALKSNGFKFMLKDVDKDGWMDLMVFFSIPELVGCGELTATTGYLELNGCLDTAHGSLPLRGYGTIAIPPGQAI